jgi:hypothetical protein
MSRSVKSEIDRRTTDASKLAALEARKVAILEMVAGLMQEAVDLMRGEGFTAPVVQAPVVRPLMPQDIPPPSNTVIMQASQLVPQQAAPIKNPCAMCGQEAVGTEDLPGGQKKYLCRAHYRVRLAEKQQEQTTRELMGSEGTLFTRPQTTPAVPVKKILIQADPLLGAPNGVTGVPPRNNVLDDE